MISNVIFLAAFTLVADGEIQSVQSVGSASTLRVSAEAVIQMASKSGHAVTADGKAGVISVSSGAPSSAKLSGFTGSTVVIVVDGEIINSPSKPVGGVPYVPPATLKTVADKLGFKASLDVKAKVLALSSSGSSPNGSDSVVVAAQDQPTSVCEYMDRLKVLWNSTEPSLNEKATFRRLASDFQAMNSGAIKKDASQVQVLIKTLKSFSKKVDKRESGTQALAAPQEAAEVKRIGLKFLGRVQDVMKDSFWLTEQMNPDSQATKDEVEAVIAALQQGDRDVQKIGQQFNKEVLRVRGRHGCGPP